MTVDKSQFDEFLAKFGTLPEIIATFADEAVIPQLQSEAGSQRNIITGTYEGTWDVVASESEVDITTNAEYWVFLEYGTSRGIQPKPVVHEVAQTIPQDLGPYILRGVTQL